MGKLTDTINIAVRASDNLTTVNQYPKEVPEIERTAKEERKSGIDYTGVADALYVLGLSYGSQEANHTIGELYKHLRDTARVYSVRLGIKKGSFPLWRKSSYYPGDKKLHEFLTCPICNKKLEHHDHFVQCDSCSWAKFEHIRNMHLLTQAPTGTRSRKLGVSFGIEPQYYKWYKSHVMEGTVVYNTNRILEWYLKQYAEKAEIKYEDLRDRIDEGEDFPVLEAWVEAHDLKPEQHLEVQAIAQQWIDQAVSKTINLPKEATPEDIKEIYIKAWKMGCKGITVYREGSHYREVIGEEEKCEGCGAEDLLKVEGCAVCLKCGWSKCSV